MSTHQHYPCGRSRPMPVTRREMLARCASGFSAVALAGLMDDRAFGAELGKAGHGPHHRPRAKNVIFLYMDGGPSQVDTFDPKPRLDREHGQPMRMRVEPTQFNNNGNVLKSPWRFRVAVSVACFITAARCTASARSVAVRPYSPSPTFDRSSSPGPLAVPEGPVLLIPAFP